jgi:hypothetical protein
MYPGSGRRRTTPPRLTVDREVSLTERVQSSMFNVGVVVEFLSGYSVTLNFEP